MTRTFANEAERGAVRRAIDVARRAQSDAIERLELALDRARGELDTERERRRRNGRELGTTKRSLARSTAAVARWKTRAVAAEAELRLERRRADRAEARVEHLLAEPRAGRRRGPSSITPLRASRGLSACHKPEATRDAEPRARLLRAS